MCARPVIFNARLVFQEQIHPAYPVILDLNFSIMLALIFVQLILILKEMFVIIAKQLVKSAITTQRRIA